MDNNIKQILIISYLFEPDNSVGSKRASYWAKNINRLASDIECDVISTTYNTQITGVRKYIHLPNPNRPKGLIKDEGVTWKNEIKKWLIRSNTFYDVVIMSGSPFMYFSLADSFKKQGSKIVLDFRDPFANNPRFNNSILKIKIKKFFEKKFNRIADRVISVNDFCLNLLYGHQHYTDKFLTIRNGYEEMNISSDTLLQKSNGINFIYAGTFFSDRNPDNLLAILAIHNDFLHHIGRERDEAVKPPMLSYGLRPYNIMLKAIDESDAGVILCSGKPFESTTKIYDYIYRKKPIWVISNEEITHGGIWDELKDYPAVVWSLNNQSSIAKGYEKMKMLIGAKIDIDVSSFSREFGLKQLIKTIRELCD